MFEGVCSHSSNAKKVLRSFFKSDRLRPQALRRFSFCELFLLRLLGQKKKWGSDLGVKTAVTQIIVTFNLDVLFLFLSCEREKEPKMRRRIAALFGQANVFVPKRHKFAYANHIILHYTNELPVRQDRP